MKPENFFLSPKHTFHKQYEALRSFFTGELSAKQAGDQFGYTKHSMYSLIRDFKKNLTHDDPANLFFASRKTGRKEKEDGKEIKATILALRKKYLSVSDIKAVLDVQGYKVSERHVYNVLKKDGFDRLPRRKMVIRERSSYDMTMKAPQSFRLVATRSCII